MSSLLPFIFNTIRKRAIDPTNKRFFLPVVLEGADGSNRQGKLLPVEEDSWSIGPITGDAGSTISTAFENQWATYLEKVKKVDLSNQYPIASPKTPNAILNMGGAKKLTISGLENIFVLPKPTFTPISDGYRVSTTLELDYWDGSAADRPSYPMLTIAGGYSLQQSLVLANKGATTPNGNGDMDIDGAGMVNIEVDNAFVDVVFNVVVKDSGSAGRQLDVNVTSLLFRGEDAGTTPSLNIQSLTIDASVSAFLLDVWKQMAAKAIESPDGSAGIFRNLNVSLNQPSNLGPLSKEMSAKLASAIDGLLGKAGNVAAIQPSSTLNPVDRYIFDRIRFALNSPQSSLFLPQLLCQTRNPSLSPLKVQQIALPTLTILGTPWQNGSLTNVDVVGLTNVQAPPTSIQVGNDDTLGFTGVLGGWNPPPPVSCSGGIAAPPAKGTADFSITPQNSGPLTGKLDLTVSTVNVVCACHTAGMEDSDLTITIDSLQLSSSNVVSSIQVSLDIQSVFTPMINKAINTQGTLEKILDTINSELSGKLSEIGAEVTTYAREAIKNGLS